MRWTMLDTIKVEVNDRHKMGLELAWLLTSRHKFVCFDVTACEDINCARSSLCQAHKLSQKSIRMEF